MKMQSRACRRTNMFREFFSATVGIVLSSFFFLGSAFLIFSMRYWTQEKMDLLKENVARVAQSAEEIYDMGAGARVLRPVLASNAKTLDATFLLFDAQGRVLACGDFFADAMVCPAHQNAQLSQSATERSLGGSYQATGTLDGYFAHAMLVSTHPFQFDGQAAGFVLAAQNTGEGLKRYLGGVMRLFIISALLVLALTFVVVYYISFRMVRPVRDMVRATRQYAKGDFSYRVAAKENVELSQLAESFNSMAVSLATLESSRRSFVANVSHELKTPMTTIGGFIDGILDGTIERGKQRHYLQLVSAEVGRLSRLVTGMLNLSKMEAGEFKLNREKFDINDSLFHAALSFEQMIAEKKLILIGLENLEPIFLHGDKDLLFQVFYNLIDNAVKFTPPGGRIEFYAQLHNPKAPEAGRIFCFGLRNTGIGIASEELDRIFERFYKADKSRSYDVKGAGLGLYLAKTIVEMHGGQMKADSDGESYTEFAVLIPMEEEKGHGSLGTHGNS
ncbi:MAG: HAMP domain-containing histidine kinase [Oscillospiraceae bacterium]|jgi:signal transduction histidine kinase|nr:HAMP domain-containing histidine kinase [Oscillospiraceae bacterium]